MSTTLFRTGIWVIIATLAAYVIRETYPGDVSHILTEEYLQRALLVGLGAIALGVVAWLLGKLAPKKKASCKICRRTIPAGAVYCRIHLQEVLESARHADVVPRRR